MANKEVEANFKKLNPEQQEALNWHAGLIQHQALISGDKWAAAHPEELRNNILQNFVTGNEEGLGNLVKDFKNPQSKAAAEAHFNRPPTPMPSPTPMPMPSPTPMPSPPAYVCGPDDCKPAPQLSNNVKELVAKTLEGINAGISAGKEALGINESQNVPKVPQAPGKGGRE